MKKSKKSPPAATVEPRPMVYSSFHSTTGALVRLAIEKTAADMSPQLAYRVAEELIAASRDAQLQAFLFLYFVGHLDMEPDVAEQRVQEFVDWRRKPKEEILGESLSAQPVTTLQ